MVVGPQWTQPAGHESSWQQHQQQQLLMLQQQQQGEARTSVYEGLGRHFSSDATLPDYGESLSADAAASSMLYVEDGQAILDYSTLPGPAFDGGSLEGEMTADQLPPPGLLNMLDDLLGVDEHAGDDGDDDSEYGLHTHAGISEDLSKSKALQWLNMGEVDKKQHKTSIIPPSVAGCAALSAGGLKAAAPLPSSVSGCSKPPFASAAPHSAAGAPPAPSSDGLLPYPGHMSALSSPAYIHQLEVGQHWGCGGGLVDSAMPGGSNHANGNNKKHAASERDDRSAVAGGGGGGRGGKGYGKGGSAPDSRQHNNNATAKGSKGGGGNNAQALSHVGLLVAYLPRSADAVCLRRVFSDFGDVAQAYVVCGKDGTSKCYGFVCFKAPDAASAALQACRDGKVIMTDESGKAWHVKASWANHASPLMRQMPGGGSKGNKEKGGSRSSRKQQQHQHQQPQPQPQPSSSQTAYGNYSHSNNNNSRAYSNEASYASPATPASWHGPQGHHHRDHGKEASAWGMSSNFYNSNDGGERSSSTVSTSAGSSSPSEGTFKLQQGTTTTIVFQ